MRSDPVELGEGQRKEEEGPSTGAPLPGLLPPADPW
jgi:hypothetical protein